jgi:hypothetical protein
VARPAPPSHLNEPVHVIRGLSATGSLREAGGREFITLQDQLCPGPCDPSPARHLRKRRAYVLATANGYTGPDARQYREHFTWLAEHLLGAREFAARLSAYPRDRPVILWTFSSWPDCLGFWWVLDALRYAPADRLWVAEPRLPEGANRDDCHPPWTLGCSHPAAFRAAFADLRPVAAHEVKAGASLWRKFASASPLDFDRARRTRTAAFPDPRAASSRVPGAPWSAFPQPPPLD